MINFGERVFSDFNYRLTIKIRDIRLLIDNLEFLIKIGIKGKRYMRNHNMSHSFSYISFLQIVVCF